ncbi:UNVERIFIED_CONTAM: Pentatricopeptide repeat-containing protein, mitochondrial [Sesamum angustifolium]|uniref:Pentatricopeptide repeat-containing protein, mitochondrial n=1 Tax=Sesamum angustifolium TaxID=2727405 RepID=A0AAW2PU87_9LAMI
MLQKQVELITTERGVLRPTERTYVKLIKAFLEADQAHDLLDEMRLAGIRISSSVYNSLLKAYYKENRMGEITSLVRDARKAGLQLDASSYDVLIQSRVLEKDTEGALNLFKEMKDAKIPRGGHKEFDQLVKHSTEGKEDGLMSKLLQEIKEGQKVDSGVHDWNNVIHFFCKKRLMQDAEKALKKMRALGHAPNAQTFHSMVTGYAAIGGKYIEVAELWGEMKSFAFSSGMKFDLELLDAVLYTFVRGGFFIRASEVVEMMEKGNMFIDKYKYRALFLKVPQDTLQGQGTKIPDRIPVEEKRSSIGF